MRNSLVVIGIGALVILAGVYVLTNYSSQKETPMPAVLTLTSSAFKNEGSIPAKFTCDESQVSPPISIAGVPAEAQSLILIVDDPDVPKALKPDGVFDHWVLFNIPPNTKEIGEGGAVGTLGASGTGKPGYVGPCPPKEYEPSEHRYFFKLYALDSTLSLKEGATKSEVERAMQGHVIGEAQLMGKYKRR